MDAYRVKHKLSYQQFASIINKLSFHNLNFDKNFVKYYCERLKKNYVGLLKIGKRTEALLLLNFWNQLFFQLIQRKYILNHWKINHLLESILNENKELISKLNESTRQISSLEETTSVANQRDTEEVKRGKTLFSYKRK